MTLVRDGFQGAMRWKSAEDNAPLLTTPISGVPEFSLS
jgi:hypothetical protein